MRVEDRGLRVAGCGLQVEGEGVGVNLEVYQGQGVGVVPADHPSGPSSAGSAYSAENCEEVSAAGGAYVAHRQEPVHSSPAAAWNVPSLHASHCWAAGRE